VSIGTHSNLSRSKAHFALRRVGARDNKLGGVEGFKTPVLAHFDPPHDTRAPLSSSDPTPMVVRLRRGCSGYRVGWWGVAHGAEYAFLPQVLV